MCSSGGALIQMLVSVSNGGLFINLPIDIKWFLMTSREKENLGKHFNVLNASYQQIE